LADGAVAPDSQVLVEAHRNRETLESFSEIHLQVNEDEYLAIKLRLLETLERSLDEPPAQPDGHAHARDDRAGDGLSRIEGVVTDAQKERRSL
jgi:hypothetical protein